jgi:hypothetical protein
MGNGKPRKHHISHGRQFSRSDLWRALSEGYSHAEQIKDQELSLTREITEIKALLDNKKAELKGLQKIRIFKRLCVAARRERLIELIKNDLRVAAVAKMLEVPEATLYEDLKVLTDYIRWREYYDQW